MDYINGSARDIGRRKEVRFLSYLQGIPFVQVYAYAQVCMRVMYAERFVVEGSSIWKRTSSVRILMTTVPPLFISSSIRYHGILACMCNAKLSFTVRDNSYVLIVDFTSGCRLRATCVRRACIPCESSPDAPTVTRTRCKSFCFRIIIYEFL